MKQKTAFLLNGIEDLSPLAEKVKLKGYPDKLMPKFRELSRTTIFRCIKGTSNNDNALRVRKEFLRMIKAKQQEIEQEEQTKRAIK